MIELQANESILHATDSDPVYEEQFMDSYPVTTETLLDVHFTTARDWESEETEDGGFTINTKPDPNLHIHQSETGHIVALVVPTAEPLIFAAFHVAHDDLGGFIERVVRSIEEDFDGIESRTVKHATSEYDEYRENIDAVMESLPTGA